MSFAEKPSENHSPWYVNVNWRSNHHTGAWQKASKTRSIIKGSLRFIRTVLYLSGICTQVLSLDAFTRLLARGDPRKLPHCSGWHQPTLRAEHKHSCTALSYRHEYSGQFKGGPLGLWHSDLHQRNREISFEWWTKADSWSDSFCTQLHGLSDPILLQMQKFNYRALHCHLENKAAALCPCSSFWGEVSMSFCCCFVLVQHSGL